MQYLQALRSLVAVAFLCLSAPLLAAIQLTPVVSSGLSSPIFVGHAGDGTEPPLHRGAGRRHPRAAAGRLDANGLPRHPHESPLGRRARTAGPRLPSAVRDQRPVLRLLHAAGDGAIVIAEYRVSGDPNVADTDRDRPVDDPASDQHQPQRRHARVRARRLPLHRRRRRRLRQRPAEQRAEHQRAARQDPAHRRRSSRPGRGYALLVAAPTIRSSGDRGRDEIFSIGLRNPVALQLRSPHATSTGSPTSARARARRSTRRS